MAKATSEQTRVDDKEFEGLLNNLEDWELSFTNKGKNGKQTSKKVPLNHSSGIDQYNVLKEYETLSQLSSSSRSQDSFVDACSEKELGNQFYKKQKFNEAIDCYSRSIALSPSAVAFANRAMAYIKIKRYQEAESDCSEALNLDDRYIKAYSRRSTARKELGKLKEAIDDAEFALRLEPQNHELKKQYEESKSLLKKEILKKVSGESSDNIHRSSLGKSYTGKNVAQKPKPISLMSSGGVTEDDKTVRSTSETIVEMVRNNVRSSSDADSGKDATKRKLKDQKQMLRTSVQELAAKAANVAKAEAAKNIVPPASACQFELSWRGLSGDYSLQARLLKTTSPAALPGMFKNALSASLLFEIIRCIGTFYLEETALAIEYLQYLTKIPRFNVIIMCLSSADKSDITKIWDEVFTKCTADHTDVISDLRPRFCIKQ